MNAWFVRLARIGAVLALVVVMLGAYVRLTDAGLGCPDWPGCYGRLVVPHPATTAEELGSEYTRPLEAGKAWREMIHRYLASTLGLVCVALAAIAWRNRRDPSQPWRVPLALVGAHRLPRPARHVDRHAAAEADRRRRRTCSAGSRRSRCSLSLGRWRTVALPAADRRPAPARRRGGGRARAADLARRLDERELRGARLPGFPDLPNAVVARDRRLRGRLRALARASASTTKAACSITRRASPCTSRIGSAPCSRRC